MGSASNVGSKGSSLRGSMGPMVFQWDHTTRCGFLPLDPTFEADPIGRRLECRPKKGININFNRVLIRI